MADMERNISILATTLMTTDGTSDDGDNATYDSNVNKKTRFKKEVRMDTKVQVKAGVDMNSTKITELSTPTASTDAANKSYVDAREAAAEAKDARSRTSIHCRRCRSRCRSQDSDQQCQSGLSGSLSNRRNFLREPSRSRIEDC